MLLAQLASHQCMWRVLSPPCLEAQTLATELLGEGWRALSAANHAASSQKLQLSLVSALLPVQLPAEPQQLPDLCMSLQWH